MRETAQRPKGAKPERRRTVTARNAEERQMPNGAKCRRARDARERANGAKANDAMGKRRTLMVVQLLSVVGAPFGISRRLASGDVWHLATFGISRCYCPTPFGSCAVRALRRPGRYS